MKRRCRLAASKLASLKAASSSSPEHTHELAASVSLFSPQNGEGYACRDEGHAGQEGSCQGREGDPPCHAREEGRREGREGDPPCHACQVNDKDKIGRHRRARARRLSIRGAPSSCCPCVRVGRVPTRTAERHPVLDGQGCIR